MIQIILLVFGVIALVRLPRLLKAQAADYGNVDPEAFARWKSAEKASAIWLIIASWGVLILQVACGIIAGIALGFSHASKETIDNASLSVTIVGLALFLLMLVPTAIYGSKAKKQKEAAGIPWPKKA